MCTIKYIKHFRLWIALWSCSGDLICPWQKLHRYRGLSLAGGLKLKTSVLICLNASLVFMEKTAKDNICVYIHTHTNADTCTPTLTQKSSYLQFCFVFSHEGKLWTLFIRRGSLNRKLLQPMEKQQCIASWEQLRSYKTGTLHHGTGQCVSICH